MRQFLLTVCVLLGTTMLCNSMAHACINDRDTVRIEREFRKNYEFKSGGDSPSAEPESPQQYESKEPLVQSLARYGLAGSGGVFMLATVGFVAYNFRKIGSP